MAVGQFVGQASRLLSREVPEKVGQNLASNGPINKAGRFLFSPGKKSRGFFNEFRQATGAEGRALRQEIGESLGQARAAQQDQFDILRSRLGDEQAAETFARIQSATGDDQANLIRSLANQIGDEAFGNSMLQTQSMLADATQAQGLLTDRATWGLPNAAAAWMTEGGLVQSGARMGMGAFGVGAAARTITGQGTPTRNRYGQRDIAGIPFI